MLLMTDAAGVEGSEAPVAGAAFARVVSLQGRAFKCCLPSAPARPPRRSRRAASAASRLAHQPRPTAPQITAPAARAFQPPEPTDEPQLSGRDSSIKKNAALTKKLRGITEEARAQLLGEVARLNHSKVRGVCGGGGSASSGGAFFSVFLFGV